MRGEKGRRGKEKREKIGRERKRRLRDRVAKGEWG